MQPTFQLGPGEYWSKVPLVVLYLYIAACSLRVAIKVDGGKLQLFSKTHSNVAAIRFCFSVLFVSN